MEPSPVRCSGYMRVANSALFYAYIWCIFPKIEALLVDRPYTVFSAHTHTYHYDQRNGCDYITTATSAAINLPRPGAIDHVVWVTMTREGPKIANLLVNGILDKKGPPKDDPLEHIGMYRPKG